MNDLHKRFSDDQYRAPRGRSRSPHSHALREAVRPPGTEIGIRRLSSENSLRRTRGVSPPIRPGDVIPSRRMSPDRRRRSPLPPERKPERRDADRPRSQAESRRSRSPIKPLMAVDIRQRPLSDERRENVGKRSRGRNRRRRRSGPPRSGDGNSSRSGDRGSAGELKSGDLPGRRSRSGAGGSRDRSREVSNTKESRDFRTSAKTHDSSDGKRSDSHNSSRTDQERVTGESPARGREKGAKIREGGRPVRTRYNKSSRSIDENKSSLEQESENQKRCR